MSDAITRSATRPWMGNLAAALVGAVLVFSSVTKILAPKAFLATMESYGLFPGSSLLLLATGVTGLELMLGVLLITGVFRRTAVWVSLPLMLAFLGLLIFGLAKGLESCGCFGQAVSVPPAVEIGIDALLLVLLLVAFRHATSLGWGPAGLRHTLAWGALCVGAAWFLAGNPSLSAGNEELTLQRTDLTPLEAEATPPLALPDEAFVFLFSAECEHCWAFASAVENMALRVPDLHVVGVTFSSPDAIDIFVQNFAPTYPIHVVPSSIFDAVTDEYPAAIWISRGQVEKTWLGFVPSHLELANLGGYSVVEGPLQTEPEPATLDDEEPPVAESPFGGPMSTRH